MRREPPTMGKQLVNLSLAAVNQVHFFVIYKAGANPRRIGDKLVLTVVHFI